MLGVLAFLLFGGAQGCQTNPYGSDDLRKSSEFWQHKNEYHPACSVVDCGEIPQWLR